MATFLLIVYILICILTLVFYFRRDYGAFQFPFLLACVNVTFVLPQLIAIRASHSYEPGFLDLTLGSIVLCTLFANIGFHLGERAFRTNNQRTIFKQRTSVVALLFFFVGSVAYYLNRGVYRGGFVEGEFVIINFFTGYVLYSLVLAFIGRKNRAIPSLLFWFIFIGVCLIYFDRIILSGRRSDTVRIVLIVSFFIAYLSKSKRIYRFVKWLIPLFFVVGMIVNTRVSDYRINAFDDVSFWDNVNSLDFSGAKDRIMNSSEGEIYLCALAINHCEANDVYNYGASDWNRIIHDFVPSVIVGRKTKESLMIKNDSDAFTSALTASGATLTGYYDAFASFGLLGFIKFLLIGLLMGYVWHKKDSSDTSLMMYFCLLTSSLNIATHSTSFFTSGLLFFLIFVYSFMVIIQRRHLDYDNAL